jgi:hypothetical protein
MVFPVPYTRCEALFHCTHQVAGFLQGKVFAALNATRVYGRVPRSLFLSQYNSELSSPKRCSCGTVEWLTGYEGLSSVSSKSLQLAMGSLESINSSGADADQSPSLVHDRLLSP